jgi:hypothetical protein
MMRIAFQSWPGQIVLKTLSWKYPKQKTAGRLAQVIGYLPSKYEALNSNPNTTKKKKKKEKGYYFGLLSFIHILSYYVKDFTQ